VIERSGELLAAARQCDDVVLERLSVLEDLLLSTL
jgi:hypothetical protein